MSFRDSAASSSTADCCATRAPNHARYRYAAPSADVTINTRAIHHFATEAKRTPAIGHYQCTPRISEAKAICSWLGADSFSALRSPLAAAESGNSSNAVFITTS